MILLAALGVLAQDFLRNRPLEDLDCPHVQGSIPLEASELEAISKKLIEHPLLTQEDLKGMQEYFASGASNVWARPYDKYLHYFGPLGFDPSSMKGNLVVDIGSGLSPFVDVLNKQGVRAKGADIIFHPHFGYKVKETRGHKGGFGYAVGYSGKEDHHSYFHLGQARGINFKHRIGASATHLPFEDDSVDAATSLMVLGYLPDSGQRAAVSEILRVLKPGGRAYIVTNDDEGDRFASAPAAYDYLKTKGISPTHKTFANGRSIAGVFSFTKPRSATP